MRVIHLFERLWRLFAESESEVRDAAFRRGRVQQVSERPGQRRSNCGGGVQSVCAGCGEDTDPGSEGVTAEAVCDPLALGAVKPQCLGSRKGERGQRRHQPGRLWMGLGTRGESGRAVYVIVHRQSLKKRGAWHVPSGLLWTGLGTRGESRRAFSVTVHSLKSQKG